MRETTAFPQIRLAVFGSLFLLAIGWSKAFSQTAASINDPADAVGVHGGLCVQVGANDLTIPLALGGTGRFVVQVLDEATDTFTQAQRELSRHGLYGLVSVDRWRNQDHLPYTENLVNLLVLRVDKPSDIPTTELTRVLCPNGALLVPTDGLTPEQLKAAGFVDVRNVQLSGTWLAARKPWPAEMDEWTHPRHSAAGNAVSKDMLAGPPRRVRWVVAALDEVRGLVSASGRNFYGAALARDAFNGLRLWSRDLVSPSAKEFVLKNLPGNVPYPVAAGDVLFAVTAGKLLALDAVTGETIREYPEAGQPRQLLHDNGRLIVADSKSVRSVDPDSGRLLWTYSASEPNHVVCGDDYVALLQGQPKRGEKVVLVGLDKASGKPRWTRSDIPWASKVTRAVYSQGLLAYEVSSFNDHADGNAMYVLSASDGKSLWDREYAPGMNHARQARAMFVGNRLWILHGGRVDKKTRVATQCSALDLQNGNVLQTFDAGLTHCFPPVATPRFLLSGEMNFTDLATGGVDANHISKAACGREVGWVPANGLVYVTPKHCVCWPMLRGYAALAPEPKLALPESNLEDRLERGPAYVEVGNRRSAIADSADWPVYRHDAWRSGSTTDAAPKQLETLWSVELGGIPAEGPIVVDWHENPYIKGPITPPVIAQGHVVIARPDAHEVVALDPDNGSVLWRFVADGRVDTSPTLYRGLCLFGTKAGSVYCLRAKDGQVVWRLQAAPADERIVAYGQVESPWPVSGSVLVMNDTLYFAAGRQSLADGGILIYAVDPATGVSRWVQRLDSVPQQGFYECSGLEFDNYDLLYQEGDRVAMSRWSFDQADGEMRCDRWNVYAKQNTGGGDCFVPRGSWSYAPRQQRRIPSHTHRRPLVVFRDKTLLGCLQGARTIFRRDFDLEGGEKVENRWITGWAASELSRKGKMPWPGHRLAEKAAWQVDVFDGKSNDQTIDALLLAGDRLFLVGSRGEFQVRSAANGTVVRECKVPAPLWDGLAAARGKLYLSTVEGKLLCLGDRKGDGNL